MSSLLARTGVSFSDNFVKEIMSSSGDYADSLYTMTELTDEELQKISDIYEENSLFDQIQTVIDDAAAWYLRCIEAGETGIKGVLLLRMLAAQVEAIKRNVSNEELPQLPELCHQPTAYSLSHEREF